MKSSSEVEKKGSVLHPSALPTLRTQQAESFIDARAKQESFGVHARNDTDAFPDRSHGFIFPAEPVTLSRVCVCVCVSDYLADNQRGPLRCSTVERHKSILSNNHHREAFHICLSHFWRWDARRQNVKQFTPASTTVSRARRHGIH